MHSLARHVVLLLTSLVLIGCSESKTSQQAARLDVNEQKALDVAKVWVQQQLDPDSYEYKATPKENGWSVYVVNVPPKAGEHWVLQIDDTGKVTEVFFGK